MTDTSKNYPPCYGNLDTVFPLGEDGLRHTPESCMSCHYKTECLRKAMGQKGGNSVRQEMVDRAYQSGQLGFLERWLRKKALSIQQKKKS